MAAFRPTGIALPFVYYDLYPPGKVVSCFKGAVPPLTNSLGFFWCICLVRVKGEAGRLNFYPVPRQPAITKFGRSVTSTRSSSHSFATETGLPFMVRLSWSSSLGFGLSN